MKKEKEKCYLCKNNTASKAFSKQGWNILHCNNCGLYSLDFKGSYFNFIKDYYNKLFFTGSKKRAGYCNYEGDHWAEKKNMLNYLNGIRRFNKKGTLLDIGCATGIFLQEAEKKKFDVYGLDVSSYAIKIAKKRFGGRVKKTSIEKSNFPKNHFDVITMFDVIEHLQDPRKVLLTTSNHLKKGGLLVINTGDVDSITAKIQGKSWHFFIPPQHFFYFSKKTLTNLLEQTGFRVIKIDRKGKWVSFRYLFHLARQIQEDVFGKLGFALVGKNVLGKIPIYLNLFDNITVYAVKEKKKTNKTN